MNTSTLLELVKQVRGYVAVVRGDTSGLDDVGSGRDIKSHRLAHGACLLEGLETVRSLTTDVDVAFTLDETANSLA